MSSIDDEDDLFADERAASKEEQRLLLQQREDDLKLIMSTKSGRRWMWRMLERTGVYRVTFRTNGEGDFLEGVRSVGVALLAEMHRWCLEETILMMRENANG